MTFCVGQIVYSSNNNKTGIIIEVNEQDNGLANWYHVQFQNESVIEAKCRSCPECSLKIIDSIIFPPIPPSQ